MSFFLQKSGVTQREVDDELVVLNRGTKQVHQLNRTATYIWKELDKKKSVEEIAQSMARHFDVPPKRALLDVRRVVEELRSLGLLRRE